MKTVTNLHEVRGAFKMDLSLSLSLCLSLYLCFCLSLFLERKLPFSSISQEIDCYSRKRNNETSEFNLASRGYREAAF